MRQWIFGIGLALAAAGCTSGGGGSSIPTPTTPTATAITEPFSGTVAVAGNDVHPFTVVTSNGTLSVTLTAAGPPATIFMGLGIGTYSAPTCSLISTAYLTTQAGTTPQLSGTITAGSYCVMVYDVGNQSAPVTYTAVVTHY